MSRWGRRRRYGIDPSDVSDGPQDNGCRNGPRATTKEGSTQRNAAVRPTTGQSPYLPNAAARTDVGFLDCHLVLEMKCLSFPHPCSLEGEVVHPRIASFFAGLLMLGISMAGSAITAQSQNPVPNVFFMFDFVLQPLAIKWACGGEEDQDLSQIEMLIVAFPEDAERAELARIAAELSEQASGLEYLPQILGTELSGQQIELLCAAALPLNIDWVTPEQFVMGDESGIPDDMEVAWANFWGVVESLQ